jgi:hypothetical protein
MNLLKEKDQISAQDLVAAREIAEFIADRAFLFTDHECRAWSLTAFGTWAELAGRTPLLTLGSPLAPGENEQPAAPSSEPSS